MDSILKAPINPEALDKEVLKEWETGDRTISKRWIPSEVFIAFWDLCRMIADDTKFTKKTRVVLEYDPQVERFAVVTLTQSETAEAAAESSQDQAR